MNFKYTLCIVSYIIFNINAVVESAFPSGLTKCHYEESSCIQQSISQAVHTFSEKGIRELNVPPFNPLRISSLKLNKNPQSPVQVELSFKDIAISGLQNGKILRVKGFDANLEKIIEIDASFKELFLQGPYSVNGRVLILPIVGKGQSKVTFSNVDIGIKVRPKAVQKNGHTYLQVDSAKLNIVPKHVSFYLENLFNGDKALGDNMNVFINENWSDIYGELKPDFSEALSLVFAHYINEAFGKFPYEEYFLQ